MTTYSLSLDDVDLALLPLRTQTYNDFLKKEYFQFEIKKKEPVEESEPNIIYKCHICAIEVPAAFASEHAASAKHRANARIASEAVRRTRELIVALPPPLANKPPGRFCPNCSTTVGKSHDKTKEHRVAVMHDKLLTELMNAYVGEDRDDSNSSDASDASDSEYVTREERKDKQVNDKALVVSSHKVNGKNEIDTKGVGLNSIKTKAKVDIKTVDKPKINDNSTLNTKTNNDIESEKDVKVECATKNTQVNAAPKSTEAKVEHVEFVSKYKELVKVAIDHYHGFIRRDDKTECIVCKTTFNSEDAHSHMFTVKHLNLMPSTMIDEHYVRKINDVYSHCILCNQVVKNANVAKHSLTAFHGERKKQAVTGYTKKTFSLPALTPEATTSYWDPVNRHIEDKMTSKISQDTDDKVKGKTKYEIHNANTIKITPNNTAQKLQNMGENSKDKDMLSMFKPTSEEIAKHVRDNRGITEAKMSDKPSNIDHNEKDISVNSEQKTNVDWPVIYPYEAIDEGNAVRCVICDCKVPNTPGNRKTHLTGSNHVKNVKTKRLLDPYEPFECGWPGWYVRCVVCHLKIRNTLCDREDHLTDSYHILNAMLCEEEDIDN